MEENKTAADPEFRHSSNQDGNDPFNGNDPLNGNARTPERPNTVYPEYMSGGNACQAGPHRLRVHLPALLSGAAIGLAALALGTLALAYGGTHPIRRRLKGDPGDLGLEFERIRFRSRDGLTISGWYVPAEDATAVIVLCHGFPNNRSELLPWVEYLKGLGMHMLLFDFRSLGESEGASSTIGLNEVEDLLGAMDYLESRRDTEHLPVGVFGLSMGGAAAIMAAAKDDRIRAVAAHASYASLDRAIHQRFNLFFGPAGKSVANWTRRWGRRWFPCDPADIAPIRAIGKLGKRPVLILHGGRDFLTRPEDADKLHRAAGQNAEIRIFPRSFHASVHPSEREEYKREIRDFFKRSLAGDAGRSRAATE